MSITEVKASLRTAGTGAALITVNIRSAGSGILATLITINASEKSSAFAATQPVLNSTPLALPADSFIECFLTQLDTDNVATGLKVYLIGIPA